jgi:Lrp/AsnC family transcriptional regulator for asnA, asnC and gidA
MVSKLDHLDLEIIRLLQKDGRISVTELAEKVKSSRATVTNRLKRLTDEELIMVKGGLNLRKFGFKMASVGLEVKKESSRKEVEPYLKNCPRVLNAFRTPEKANLQVIVWGEDETTINSTIESFRDLPNVEIVYTHYLGTPFHGNIIINVFPSNKDETPCGLKCSDCYRYENALCLGCPSSSCYRIPLQL